MYLSDVPVIIWLKFKLNCVLYTCMQIANKVKLETSDLI